MSQVLLETALSNAAASLLLALLAAAAARLGARPAVVHGLWLLVLLKLITPPLFQLDVVLPVSVPAAIPAEPMRAPQLGNELAAYPDFTPTTPLATAPATGSHALSIADLTLMLWAAGALAVLALGLRQIRRFGRVARIAEPAPASLRRQVASLSGRLGLRRIPAVRVLPGNLPPMLWAGAGRPVLLLPEALLSRLDRKARVTLLAHELAHLRRGDHWVRRLELLVRAAYWWNPVVRWACSGLRQAEEECCDAWVIWAMPSAARSYADALVETVGFLSESKTAVPAAATGVGYTDNLKWRLTMIMRGSNPRSLSRGARCAMLVFGAAVLPLLPAVAQDPAREQRDSLQSEIARTKEKIDQLTSELAETKRQLAAVDETGRTKEARRLTDYFGLLQDSRRAAAAAQSHLLAQLQELDPDRAQDPVRTRPEDTARLITALVKAREALLESDQPEEARVIAALVAKLDQRAAARPTSQRDPDAEYPDHPRYSNQPNQAKAADREDSGDRVDRLEKKVDRLADTVEKLLQVTVQRQRDQQDAVKEKSKANFGNGR